MKSDNLIVLYLFSGVIMGLTYALVALGFNVIYNATDVINFAQGEFVMLGALIAYTFSVPLKLPLIIAFPLAVIIVTIITILIEQLFISPSKWTGIFLLSAVLGALVFWVFGSAFMRSHLLMPIFWTTMGALALAETFALLGRISALKAGLWIFTFLCGGGMIFGIMSPVICGLAVRLFGIPGSISVRIGQAAGGAFALYVPIRIMLSGRLPGSDAGKPTLGAMILIGLVCGILGIATKKPVFPSGFLAAAAAMGLAALMAHLDVKPRIQSNSTILLIIITIGISILLKGIASFIWGKDLIPAPPFSGTKSIPFLYAHIKPQDLWIVSLSILTMIAFWLFYRFSLTGKAMRACSMNRKAAQLMGINVKQIVMISFGLAGAAGAVAGIIVAPNVNMEYNMGSSLGLMGFVAAIVGGLGSPIGAIIGGLTVGLLESAGSMLISSGYKNVVVFVALLAVLYLKPAGLLGVRESERF